MSAGRPVSSDSQEMAVDSLFVSLVQGAFDADPGFLRFAGLSPTQLLAQGFDRVGEPQDFHFYEKPDVVTCKGRELGVVLKVYFDGGRSLGPGLGLGKGQRLASLLACYQRLRGLEQLSQGAVAFYFVDEERREGAVIIEGSTVIRFSQWDRRSGYRVTSLEGPFPEAGAYQDLATFMVKRTLQPLALESVSSRRTGNPAFDRLLRAWTPAL